MTSSRAASHGAAADPRTTDLPPHAARAGLLVTLTLAGLAMLGPFTIDTIFPAFQQIGEDFGASEVALQQLTSAYLVSFAIMSVFHGPLSDALGRKPVMIGGLIGYLVATIGCALAPNLGILMALRCLQGACAGAATIISRVVIRDLFAGAEAQRLMARVMMIFSLAPAIAPIAGGWLLALGSWPIVFWATAIYAVVAIVATALVLPETLPAPMRQPLRARSLLASLVEVGRSPVMLRLALATAWGFAAQFLYIAAAPIIVVDLLGLGERDFWVLFVPMIVGMIAGAWLTGRLADAMPRPRLITIGFTGTVVTGILNLVLVALGPDLPGGVTPHLLWYVIGPMLVAFTVALMFAPIQLEILDLFPQHRGAAASFATFFALVGNALLAGVVAPLVTGSLLLVAAVSTGFGILAALLWLWHRTTVSGPVEPEPADRTE